MATTKDYASITSRSQNYNVIDIVKLLCSIMVFTIHVPPIVAPIGMNLTALENQINFWFQQCFCRIAVPFFFTASSFFLFAKMSEDRIDIDRTKKYCFKLLRLLGIWSILPLVGEGPQLWYLGGTVTAITFISLCLYFRVNDICLIVIACLLYGLGLLGDSYKGFVDWLVESINHPSASIIEKTWSLVSQRSRNGLFMGTIFVLMGMYFAKGKIKTKLWPNIFGFVCSLSCLIIEAHLLNNYQLSADHNMYISLVPVTFYLFSLSCSIQLKDRPIYLKIRSIGLLVYFLHLGIDSLVGYMIRTLYQFASINIQPYQYLLSLTLTCFIAVGIEVLSDSNHFKWLRWFYS